MSDQPINLTLANQALIGDIARHYAMEHSEAVNFCLSFASLSIPRTQQSETTMRASRLFRMFDDKADAQVYVDILGDLIPVTAAEYREGDTRAVVLTIDAFGLLRTLDRRDNGSETP